MNICRYEIYLGTKNKDTDIDFGNVDIIKDELSKLLYEKKIGFTITKQLGGYLKLGGNYIIEDSLKITIISDLSDNEITELVQLLKKQYNQETILVASRNIDVAG